MKSAMQFIGCITLFVGVFCVYTFWYQIGDLMHPDRGRITADIKVDNRCGFASFALIVRDTTTGRYAPLRANNTARIQTRLRNRLRVEIAPQFRDVSYEMTAVPARENMMLIAECMPKSFERYAGIPSE